MDAAGNLVFSTGDNTQASGYSPRSPRTLNGQLVDSIGLDARKASPNTNDLRGSILRITPNVGGGPAAHPNYTIPAGNMFPEGTPLTRPEIYAMGMRNPFRIMIDPITGWIYAGDVGPDAGGNGGGAYQGARGHDEFNQIKEPGWYGWPYYVADNQAYRDGSGNLWTDATLKADLANFFTLPVFTSSGALAGNPNLLPSVPEPAWIWYHRDPSSEFPETDFPDGSSGGRAAFSGAGYDWEPGSNFPRYYEGSIFLIEWMRSQILEVKNRPDGSILEITRFAPHIDVSRPHDMVFGPDGVMYMLDYGPSFGGDGPAALFKIQYLQDASTPIVQAAADVSSGNLPLSVNFDSTGTYDPDGGTLTYEWDLDGDSIIDSTDPNPSFQYTVAGSYAVQLTVTDPDGLFARANLTIHAGNNAPEITFISPANYSFFDWGDVIAYEFEVTDSEDGSTADGSILPQDVLLEASLGHGDHQHTDFQFNQTSGLITIPRDDSHPFDADLAYVFDAFYTDEGAPGVGSIAAETKAVVQPKVTMANTYDSGSGVSTVATGDPAGGDLDVIDIDAGDFIVFNSLNLTGMEAIRVRAAGQAGGRVSIRQGGLGGTEILSILVPSGSGTSYADYTEVLGSFTAGQQDLYFVFESTGGAGDLFKLNWIAFRGNGATIIPNRPAVSSVSLTSPTNLSIEFDQVMDYGTLANVANYTIDNGASISAATAWPNQLGVDLTVSSLGVGAYHLVELGAIEDLAGDTLASQTSVTFVNAPEPDPVFLIGLNAAGSDYTDTNGNLYIDDTTTLSNTAASLLIDFRAASGAVVSTVANFQAADSRIQNGTPINVVTDSTPTNLSLSANGLTGVTVTQTNASGPFNTNKGSWNGTAILDGYVYSNTQLSSANHPVLTLSGLGDILEGDVVTLTLWAVGDTADSDAGFDVVYNGVSLGSQMTNYDGTIDETRVQYSFTKVDTADSVVVNWGRFGATTTGLNGLSLTARGFAYLATQDTNAWSGTDSISGTTDDTIYQTHRWKIDDFGYQFPVDNGNYQVLLRFAETYEVASSKRLFNVSIEGSEDIFPNDGLDVFLEAGHDAAYDVLIENVVVTDNLLNVDFIYGVRSNPMISAIGVFQVDPFGSNIPDPSFARYLNSNPQAKFSVSSDSDNDSVVTLLEYAFGGAEGQTDTMLLPDFVAREGGEFDFEYSRPVGLPDVTYILEATEDLASASWTSLSPTIVLSADGPGKESVRMENIKAAAVAAGLTDPDACFYRLRVRLDPIQ